MTAYQASELLALRLGISNADANVLRRAQLTLHRWAELECGDGRGHIERDEETGAWFYHNDRASFIDPHDRRAWHRIADRERGALQRVARVCKDNGLSFYHQTDPRGCALYVSREPLTDSDYNRGVATC